MLANDNVEPSQLIRHLEFKHPENADKHLQFFPLMFQAPRNQICWPFQWEQVILSNMLPIRYVSQNK